MKQFASFLRKPVGRQPILSWYSSAASQAWSGQMCHEEINMSVQFSHDFLNFTTSQKHNITRKMVYFFNSARRNVVIFYLQGIPWYRSFNKKQELSVILIDQIFTTYQKRTPSRSRWWSPPSQTSWWAVGFIFRKSRAVNCSSAPAVLTKPMELSCRGDPERHVCMLPAS